MTLTAVLSMNDMLDPRMLATSTHVSREGDGAAGSEIAIAQRADHRTRTKNQRPPGCPGGLGEVTLSRGGRRGLCAAYARLQAFALRLVGESLARLSRRVTTDRAVKLTACRHHRSVREPARPTSIRVAWNRERCVLLFASRASVDFAPGASLCVRRQALRRASLHVSQPSLRAVDADPSRMVPYTTLEEPEPRGTTSDVSCRFSGTDYRLQPTHRCPNRPRILR